jgi:Protein of unknown function (DUF3040)
VLSDHEQRVLEELERGYVTDAQEPVPSSAGSRQPRSRTVRPPGIRPVVVLGCTSVTLLVLGVPAAALALATATALGWLFWRLWSHRGDGGPIAAPPVIGAGDGQGGTERRLGASVRNYLKWLSEAE